MYLALGAWAVTDLAVLLAWGDREPALGRPPRASVYFARQPSSGDRMDSAAELHGDYDLTDVPAIVRGSVLLGLFEAWLVLLFSLRHACSTGRSRPSCWRCCSWRVSAPVTLLPGPLDPARTIEGIAGAAGIGLGATFVFLLVDVVLLQNIGTYTNRWWQIGGSNWWYHPVWWMVGTFLPWMGAWILANQMARNGRGLRARPHSASRSPSPSARGRRRRADRLPWRRAGTSPTFGIAFLPGLALATAALGAGWPPA